MEVNNISGVDVDVWWHDVVRVGWEPPYWSAGPRCSRSSCNQPSGRHKETIPFKIKTTPPHTQHQQRDCLTHTHTRINNVQMCQTFTSLWICQ